MYEKLVRRGYWPGPPNGSRWKRSWSHVTAVNWNSGKPGESKGVSATFASGPIMGRVPGAPERLRPVHQINRVTPSFPVFAVLGVGKFDANDWHWDCQSHYVRSLLWRKSFQTLVETWLPQMTFSFVRIPCPESVFFVWKTSLRLSNLIVSPPKKFLVTAMINLPRTRWMVSLE